MEQGPHPIEDMIAGIGEPDPGFANGGRGQDRVIGRGEPVEGGTAFAREVIGVAQLLRRYAAAVLDPGLEIVVEEMVALGGTRRERRHGFPPA